MEILLEGDIKSLTRKLTRLQKKQVPFAAALAIKDTAFRTRHYIVRRVYPQSFKVRNKRFAGVAIRVKPNRVSKTRLVAHVYDSKDTQILKNQTFGLTKTPHASRYLKVPKKGAEFVYTRSGKGRKFNKTYVTQGRYGPVIMQRRGRGGRKARFLYGLRTSVNVDKNFPFFERGEMFARRVFPKAFKRGLATALATAR